MYAPSQSWDLETVLAGGPDASKPIIAGLAARLASLDERARGLRGLLEDAADWRSILAEVVDVYVDLNELDSWAACHAAAAASSTSARRAEAATSGLLVDRNQVLAVVDAALVAAPAAELDEFLAHPDLERLRPYIRSRVRSSALKLKGELRGLALEMQRESLTGYNDLHDLLMASRSGEIEVDGEKRRLGVAELGAFRSHADEAVRRSVHEASVRTWQEVTDQCALALNNITGARLSRCDRLGIDELAWGLDSNRIDSSILDAMWQGGAALRPTLVAYMELKAQLLGKTSLDWWDLTAPVGGGSLAELTWEQAQELVVSSFHSFHPELAEFASRALRGSWVEAEARPGKRAGGFCASFPVSRESRIFTTFGGSVDNTLTLAHELGHAFHNSVLHEQHAGRRTVPYALAETASTFAEAVLLDQLIERYPESRVFLLDQMLSQGLSFLMNIRARFTFEQKLYALRRQGTLDAPQLTDAMTASLREAYADSLGSYDPTFWASKLHFYIGQFGFYNWPYTFGYLFSAAVYERSRGVDDFMPQLRELLSRTGWDDAAPLATAALGVNLSDPEFWEAAARPLERHLAALRAAV